MQQQQQQYPNGGAQRFRKRPVSFGNPALGTYTGNVYTLEGNDSTRQEDRPIIEGAETTEMIVAMVGVPPEQVPEGVLNLARAHRSYIKHVRVVIAEDCPDDFMSYQQRNRNSSSTPPPQTTTKDMTVAASSSSAIENAASMLAADEEEYGSDNYREAMQTYQTDLKHEGFSTDIDVSYDQELPDRNYLVLIQLWTHEDTATFIQDLDGQPYTILDETVTCSIYHVVALQGDDGVSLMSPIFAPSTKSSVSSGLGMLQSSSSSSTNANGNGSSSRTEKKAPSPRYINEENHNCAVCLEHMYIEPKHRFGDGNQASSILTTVCNHTFHLDCLLQWQDSPCPVCRYDHSGLNDTLSQCHVCGTTEKNYVCLICGVISCAEAGPSEAAASIHQPSNFGDICSAESGGSTSLADASENHRRLLSSHARQHYDATLHAYALDTETQHVWDFAGQGYVHRLLQNKGDGKIVETNDPNNTSSAERSLNPGLSDTQEGEVVHRKLEGFASQYYTLLKSQLEQQRIYYEGRLGEIRREHESSLSGQAGKAKTSSAQDLISALRQERKQLSSRLVTMKRKHTKVLEDVAFLKNMNESLEANKAPLKGKIAETQRQCVEARDMMQQCLPPLEEKVMKLMLQLEDNVGG